MTKKKYEVNVPGGEDRVLLHTCCAPCSSAIIECLLLHNIEPVIFYCNPNIFPGEEYVVRKEECTRYARSLDLTIIDDDYDHEGWLKCVNGLEAEPERGSRCLECFKMRLRRTAGYAHDNGFKVITTTLASSRWKSLEQINLAGRFATAHTSMPSLGYFGQDVAPPVANAYPEGQRDGGDIVLFAISNVPYHTHLSSATPCACVIKDITLP